MRGLRGGPPLPYAEGMRKTVKLILLVILSAGAVIGLAAPAGADVQDFSYDSWHVEYRVGTDGDGRAVARVTETLVARFPDFDQNRGIVRGIPFDYQGTSTDPRDFSVTDENGDPVPFELESDDTFIAVLTGNDDYVHGVQTYVIDYTLSDVVLARDDGSADEFYWDLVDSEHLQPIGEFSAEISFSAELAAQLNGNARCYRGAATSEDECGIERAADGASFSVSPLPLGPQEGVTAAIGLAPGAVVQPPARLPSFALDVLPLFVGGAGLAVAAAGGVAVGSMGRKRRIGRGTVVAQYEVPPELPPLIAASIAGVAVPSAPAEIVHLAVNGVTRIEESEAEHGIFGTRKPQPAIRLLDPSRAGDPLDARTVSALFPGGSPGDAFVLPKRDEAFGKRMQALQTAGVKQADARGYFERVRSRAGRVLGLVALGIVAVLAVFVVIGLSTRNSPTPVVCLIVGIVALILAFSGISRHRVHTRLGAETREYLEGVREFIRVAEADRLRVLQSYTGAERKQDGTVDVIHLYEQLLPYAMLFRLEKEWTRTLEVKYQESGTVPLWYPLAVSHGLSGLGGTLSQFTSSLSSATSYTSSSSGGSSGGGFSGGGGGGGFSAGR